jgi:multicomponent Na+:H+ antiporter subunit C
VDGLIDVLPYLVAGWLALIGLYGVVTSRHLLHLVLSLSVTHSAAWIVLVALGAADGTAPPIVDAAVGDAALADPVLQGLSVTDIVVGAAVTSLLLAFVVQIRKRCGTVDPAELRDLRG